ncbi:MAG: DUF1269 domain-containing protein [Puia sp.]|nr:DUF1269 domain-containing protein [Puia sp.]
MENLVFTTFSDEKKATEGLHKLKELDQIGDIVIYHIALIKKNDDNTLSLLHQEGPDGSGLPAAGAVAGSLIGLLAGPIGMAIGMMTGVMLGAADEEETGEVGQQFLDKAGKQLSPGGFALVLDVEEDTGFMIDTYMDPYQGVTLHSPVTDEYDENDDRQWKELDAEIDGEEKALKTALDKDKTTIKAKITVLKEKRATLAGQVKEKAAIRKKHLHEKIRVFDKKIGQAKDKAFEKLKAQRVKLSKDLDDYDKAVAYAFD